MKTDSSDNIKNNVKIVDVHAHMDFDEYKNDLDEVIKKCKEKGVKIIINNSVTVESNRKTLELAKKYDIIKPALGIYPTHCLEMREEEFDNELKFIEKQRPIAIGEVGLEAFRIEGNIKEKLEIMKSCLEKFVKLGIKLNIPMIVHSRNAELETVELLESMNAKKIIMHCFSGRKHLVKRIMDNDWYFSIPCSIVKLEHFRNIVEMNELGKIFTETDAPYLSPYPEIRRNEPSFIIESIKRIAEIKKMTEEEVGNTIFMNYQKLFL